MRGVGSAHLCKASLKAGDLQPHSSSTLPGSFSQLLPFSTKAGRSPLSTLWVTDPLGPSTFSPLRPCSLCCALVSSLSALCLSPGLYILLSVF